MKKIKMDVVMALALNAVLVLHFSLLFCPGELGQGDVCDRTLDGDFHRAGGNLGADAGISG